MSQNDTENQTKLACPGPHGNHRQDASQSAAENQHRCANPSHKETHIRNVSHMLIEKPPWLCEPSEM